MADFEPAKRGPKQGNNYSVLHGQEASGEGVKGDTGNMGTIRILRTVNGYGNSYQNNPSPLLPAAAYPRIFYPY